MKKILIMPFMLNHPVRDTGTPFFAVSALKALKASKALMSHQLLPAEPAILPLTPYEELVTTCGEPTTCRGAAALSLTPYEELATTCGERTKKHNHQCRRY